MRKIVLIALVCAAPLVLGTLAYVFRWSPGEPSNYGELVPPRQVSGVERGKWVLVVFDSASCDAYCERKLYTIRQLRRAMGKNMDRVERLWVLTDAGKPRAEILPAIEGTRLAAFAPTEFPGNARDHIYLVDPQGNLMMRFPREPEPAKMIKDLERLLKYTPRPR